MLLLRRNRGRKRLPKVFNFKFRDEFGISLHLKNLMVGFTCAPNRLLLNQNYEKINLPAATAGVRLHSKT